MNAVRHDRIGVTVEADGSIDIVVPASMAEHFKLLVRRGTNTYPSKHVEIMDFADRLLNPGLNNPCMKQAIYGYPKYPEGPASTHWDIPSEDKLMIAEDQQSKKDS